MAKKTRMELRKFKDFLRENGYHVSYSEYNGRYDFCYEAVHVWGEGSAEAAKLADEMGYRVEVDKQLNWKRYRITM